MVFFEVNWIKVLLIKIKANIKKERMIIKFTKNCGKILYFIL